MNRRRFLATAGLALTFGGGCLSFNEASPTTPTTPLTGSFDPFPEDAYWHRSLEVDNNLDSNPEIVTDTDIFVASGSRIVCLSLDGYIKWNVEAETPPRVLEAAESGIFYTGTGGFSAPNLGAHSREDGAELWSKEVGFHPVLVDATSRAVYVGATTDDPNSGKMPVNAYDAASGEERWRAETGDTHSGSVTHGLCLIEAFRAKVVAFSTSSGDKLWQHSFHDVTNRHYVIENTLVVLAKASVSAISLPSGERIWSKSIRDPQVLATNGARSESPETIYVGGSEGDLHAIDLSSGEIQWSKRPPVENDHDWIRGITHSNNMVILRKGNTLLGLNTANGSEQWRQVLAPYYSASSPIVIGETLFLLHSPEGNEVHVKTFDSTSGERKWRYSKALHDNLFPRYSVADDRLIMAIQPGDVFSFGTPGK